MSSKSTSDGRRDTSISFPLIRFLKTSPCQCSQYSHHHKYHYRFVGSYSLHFILVFSEPSRFFEFSHFLLKRIVSNLHPQAVRQSEAPVDSLNHLLSQNELDYSQSAKKKSISAIYPYLFRFLQATKWGMKYMQCVLQQLVRLQMCIIFKPLTCFEPDIFTITSA